MPKILADHNPIIWKNASKKERRWRLSGALLLQDKVIQQCKKDLMEYFSINNATETTTTTMWEVSKPHIRGTLLAIAARKKKREARFYKENNR